MLPSDVIICLSERSYPLFSVLDTEERCWSMLSFLGYIATLKTSFAACVISFWLARFITLLTCWPPDDVAARSSNFCWLASQWNSHYVFCRPMMLPPDIIFLACKLHQVVDHPLVLPLIPTIFCLVKIITLWDTRYHHSFVGLQESSCF